MRGVLPGGQLKRQFGTPKIGRLGATATGHGAQSARLAGRTAVSGARSAVTGRSRKTPNTANRVPGLNRPAARQSNAGPYSRTVGVEISRYDWLHSQYHAIALIWQGRHTAYTCIVRAVVGLEFSPIQAIGAEVQDHGTELKCL